MSMPVRMIFSPDAIGVQVRGIAAGLWGAVEIAPFDDRVRARTPEIIPGNEKAEVRRTSARI